MEMGIALGEDATQERPGASQPSARSIFAASELTREKFRLELESCNGNSFFACFRETLQAHFLQKANNNNNNTTRPEWHEHADTKEAGGDSFTRTACHP